MADPGREPGVLADYLLGRLPKSRRRALEARYLEDEDLYERMLAAADVLLEDHLCGLLSAAERQHVEERLLSLPWWRERLEVTRLLTVVAAGGAHSAAPEVTARPVSRRALPRRAGGALLGWAGAAAAIALALGGAWMARPRAAPHAVGGVGDTARPAAPALPTQAMPSTVDDASPLPLLRLGGLSYRDDGALPQLAVPPGARAVRVIVVLGAAPAGPYRAEIRDVEGQPLAARDGLRAAGRAGSRTLTVVWPARLLPPGDYTVAVLPDRSPPGEEALVEHAFRVR